ncbi:MAG: hypothetical protein ONB44_17300 [candidate division KSB1 bacterium]|nr:hypothetical protein [candidate division KSB1 bacterium]MDZ7303893.1 hypothetical protein [candidate division KSB1 bacterium]
MHRYFSFLFLAVILPAGLLAQEIMPLSEVKPGMSGVCRTVFRGERPEEFPVEVVDVIYNFNHPKRNIILIRLKGEKAEHTGVAFGMSGSPVFIDGKMVGALSYLIDIFLREPLAGVTPIEEMLEIFKREDSRDRELAVFVPPVPNKFLEMSLGFKEVSWENFVPLELVQRRSSLAGGIRPLDLPLTFGGAQPALVDLAASILKPAGFHVINGGATGGHAAMGDKSGIDTAGAALLQPGAAIGAVLVTGDMNVEAIGTVTYRRDHRVLAFGHPVFDAGPVEIPMSLARIFLIVPSDYASSKLGTSSSLVGTLRQDRTTGMYGVVGEPPALIPMTVRYTDETGKVSQFAFRFTAERAINTLMPLIIRFVLVNTLESARLATGENSLQLRGSIQLQDGQKITLEDFYPGFTSITGLGFLNGIMQSTGEVAATLGTIMANNFQPVKLTGIELNFTSVPGRRNATIEEVWLDRSEAEPGDTVTVLARLKAFQGPEKLFHQQLVIPNTAQGKFLTINVGGGDDLTQVEQRTMPGRFAAQNFRQLLALLQERRRNDFLYYQIRQPDQGLIIGGELLSSLPPSIYAVLQSQNLKGRSSFTREKVLSETRQQITMAMASAKDLESQKPFAVSGLKTLRIKLTETLRN